MHLICITESVWTSWNFKRAYCRYTTRAKKNKKAQQNNTKMSNKQQCNDTVCWPNRLCTVQAMTLHTVCTSHQYQPDSTASESSLRIYALFGFAEHDAGRSLWRRMDTNAATVTVKPCVCPKRQAPYTCQVQRAGRAAWKVCGRLERSSRGGEKTAIPLLAMPWAGTLKFTGNYHEKSGTYTAPHNLQNIANCGACVCDVMIYNKNQSFSIY